MADSQRKTANLFDYSAITTGYRIQWTSGNPYADVTAIMSDYIPVTEGDYALSMSLYIIGYAADKSYIGVYRLEKTWEKRASDLLSTFTVLNNTNVKFVRLLTFGTYNPITNTLMLNTGSTAKPYEPYGWVHSLRKLTTATDTFTTLPVDIYADGNNATVGISGNTVQNGTPTPDNPIMPQGTGERTGNLFSEPLTNGYTLNGTTGLPSTYDRRCATLNPIDVSDLQNVTITFSATLSRTRVIYSLFDNSTLIRRVTAIFSGTSIDVSDGNKLYICFYDIADTDTVRGSDISNLMLNSGSTALPYEPYGYKIPISSASTTTPIYLGEVQTTRKIRKFVLDGTEDWFLSTAQAGRFGLSLSDYLKSNGTITSFCSHYMAIAQKSGGTVPNNSQYFYSGSDAARYLFIVDTNCSTAADFKSYLAAQYAAGTPVTIWYVLATAETGIVNEPLMKIGGYADTVSGITVPMITGRDTFDVDTTLKPSEASLNYTGWHDTTVQEWDGSQWNE